jgi:hypothetical protein
VLLVRHGYGSSCGDVKNGVQELSMDVDARTLPPLQSWAQHARRTGVGHTDSSWIVGKSY